MSYSTILKFARDNRKNQTEAEQYFWEKVRNRKFYGHKFNRQFIIEYKLLNNKIKYFIADFYCDQFKLIVEFDGKIHDYKLEYDKDRDEILKSKAYSIIHFKNEEVFNNWEKVEEQIKEYIMV